MEAMTVACVDCEPEGFCSREKIQESGYVVQSLWLDGDMIMKGVSKWHSTLLGYKDGDSDLDTPKEVN
jgi:hypothetical protein